VRRLSRGRHETVWKAAAARWPLPATGRRDAGAVPAPSLPIPARRPGPFQRADRGRGPGRRSGRRGLAELRRCTPRPPVRVRAHHHRRPMPGMIARPRRRAASSFSIQEEAEQGHIDRVRACAAGWTPERCRQAMAPRLAGSTRFALMLHHSCSCQAGPQDADAAAERSSSGPYEQPAPVRAISAMTS
jgi:hypothetical protein